MPVAAATLCRAQSTVSLLHLSPPWRQRSLAPFSPLPLSATSIRLALLLAWPLASAEQLGLWQVPSS